MRDALHRVEGLQECCPRQREDSRRHSEPPGEQGMQDLYTVAPVYVTVYNGMCSNIPKQTVLAFTLHV